MKKKDVWLIGVAALLFLSVLMFNFLLQNEGSKIIVTCDGELFGEYSVNNNAEVEIMGKNVLVIKDGEAYMKWADCPDGLCVKSGKIKSEGEDIICLPNRVIVSVR